MHVFGRLLLLHFQLNLIFFFPKRYRNYSRINSISKYPLPWSPKFGVEEVVRSPVLNPIQHLLNEQECRLWARSYRPTSVPDSTNALAAEWDQIPAAVPKSCGKPCQGTGDCY